MPEALFKDKQSYKLFTINNNKTFTIKQVAVDKKRLPITLNIMNQAEKMNTMTRKVMIKQIRKKKKKI